MREFTTPATYTVAADENCAYLIPNKVDADPNVTIFRVKDSDGTWAPVSVGDAAAQITTLARGLIGQGVQAGDRVALMSGTRLEWVLLDMAIWSVGAVTVPIYDSSSSGQVDWILEDSDAVALIVENDSHRAIVEELDSLRSVRKVYQIDGDNPAVDDLASQAEGVDPQEVLSRRAAVGADDPATLIYTSGTTGRPKGCMITHRNLLSETRAVLESNFADLLRPGRRTLMFLPLAHVLARAITIAALEGGVEIGFTSDTTSLVESFGSFQPDFILSVPRVFEKVYNTASKNANDSGKGKIFNAAAETAVAYSQALDSSSGPGLTLKIKHAVFDKLVYSKLKAALGGQCQLAISGGAPLGARLGHFYRGAGLPVYEGYGLTETTAAFGVNTPGGHKVGSVGKPLGGNAVRIGEDDEVLVKGPVVFAGYWRNEEATEAAIVDGWFHTGDLGSLDDEGFLTITGRKKEIIVTAGGKNVAPAAMEDSLRSHPLISQAVVVGDQKPYIAALVTIDPEAFPGWKSSHGKPESASVADLVDDADLRAEIDGAVATANRTVSHAESIKKYRILADDFTEESGEMTPTMKIKRNIVVKNHADEIDGLYSK